MKKLFLVIFLSIFLLVFYSLAMAMSEEEAIKMIEEYKTCADEYGAKVEVLKAELEPLKNAVSELDKKIADLEAEIAKYGDTGEYDYYTVREGDWLAKLAEYKNVYGHGNYAKWRRIYNANKNLIKNPDLIYPGWKLKIPRP
ncbi:MAG: LysM peptidoglycan-binding domain-containing protein [Candidatus Cloacimonadota bacterium]|nr:MAG: LysM peptidoglycan-binding domain-containing protein [Candidatus Cloacimonadota bacterium]